MKAAPDDKEFSAILDSIREAMLHMLHMLGEPPRELIQTINSKSFSDILVSYGATNLPIDSREKQELLNINDEKEQAYRLLMILNREAQTLELKMNIQMKTREDLNQQQKEYFLNNRSRPSRKSWAEMPSRSRLMSSGKRAKRKNGVPKWQRPSRKRYRNWNG